MDKATIYNEKYMPSIKKLGTIFGILGVPSMTALTYKNLMEVGAPKFSEEEIAFAKELQGTLTETQIKNDLRNMGLTMDRNPIMHEEACSMEVNRMASLNASSDSGDVSQIMPMSLVTTACWPVGAPAHSWQATASTGHSIAHTGAMTAAKVMAGMIFDMIEDPALVAKMKEEHTAMRMPSSSICTCRNSEKWQHLR